MTEIAVNQIVFSGTFLPEKAIEWHGKAGREEALIFMLVPIFLSVL